MSVVSFASLVKQAWGDQQPVSKLSGLKGMQLPLLPCKHTMLAGLAASWKVCLLD